MNSKRILLVFCCFCASAASLHAQNVSLFADIQVVGVGVKQQEVTLGNHTQIESITGMSGLSAGVNIPLAHGFELSPSAGFLLRLNFSSNTSYSSSGSSSSTESSTFFVPKLGLGVSKSFIFSEDKFFQGVKLGGGPEYYWPSKLNISRDGDELTVGYDSNYGYFLRGQIIFRSFGKIQLLPNITYRNFTFTANEYQQGNLDSLDKTLKTLEARNIEIGLILMFKP